MPLEKDDQDRVDAAIRQAEANSDTKVVVYNATESQKLGRLTVICMIMNRTFGKRCEKLFPFYQN